MHPQLTIEESELSPSFNCYSSESITSKSIAKVIREDEDFEFSLILNDDVSSDIDSQRFAVFPVFNNDLVLNDEVDHINHIINHETDASFAVTSPLRNLFVDDVDETSSYSSTSEEELVDELENLPSGTFCVWRPKADGESSSMMTKCKKSSSTGSGSKRWRIRYLLRRSNSEGTEPIMLSNSKKTDSPKQKRRSGEVLNVHERFYVERRAEKEVGKRKSYLPYRKDLVGLFGNVNGLGKMLPF